MDILFPKTPKTPGSADPGGPRTRVSNMACMDVNYRMNNMSTSRLINMNKALFINIFFWLSQFLTLHVTFCSHRKQLVRITSSLSAPRAACPHYEQLVRIASNLFATS